MAILLMLGWWYTRGWLWVLDVTLARLETVNRIFAIRVLIRTLFAPWKQIYAPSSFRNFLQVAVDNAVSRAIGAVVRTTILFWVGILCFGILVIGLVTILAWPFIPLLTIILPILTISGANL